MSVREDYIAVIDLIRGMTATCKRKIMMWMTSY